MDDYERKVLQRLKDDLQHYSQKCLKIRTKTGSLDKLLFNKAQVYVHQQLEKQKQETGKVRALILKGRQQGISTYIGARYYHIVSWHVGYHSFIIAHNKEATDNLYKMALRYYDNTPDVVKPETSKSNAKELVFGRLDSGYKLGTAGVKETGRSSTIQLLHASEVAFWPNASDLAAGLLQAVPDATGTEIIFESTANGVGNFFHQKWQEAERGDNEFIAIFVPWYWQEEYTKAVDNDFAYTAEEEELANLYKLSAEQINWRRAKIQQLTAPGVDGVKVFRQEYPCVAGSQRVGTNRGLIAIDEVIGGDGCLDKTIASQWCSGEKLTVAVETELGYRLECTPDHRLYLASECFEHAAKTKGEDIQLSVPCFADKEYVLHWQSMPCRKSTLTIDEDFALFLGFFMGDGSYCGNILSFAFNKSDKSSVDIVKKLIFKLFSKEARERATSVNGIELRLHIKQLKEIFFELGVIEGKSGYIRRIVCVPDCIWRSPKHVVKQFLRGLFDADGFAGYDAPRVSFFTKHKQFAIDVQLLLLGFGITAKRNHVEKVAGNGSKYMGNEVILRAAESRLFGTLIGFVSERKNARIEAWLAVSHCGRRAREIRLQDKVKSIEPLGLQLVYDLEMNSAPHTFDAQGVLVHNCNSSEAFQLTGLDSFINADLIMQRRKNKNEVEAYGALVMGVDPARFGDDRTSIIFRQGRKAFGLMSYHKKDTMEVAGIVHTLYNDKNPAKIFIDVGGLGAGVVDRLKELIPKGVVVAVNAGAKALNENRYANKKAEMWATLKEWLEDELPVQLPDSDSLMADLCSIKYKFDSNSRLVMESKPEMKKRGLASPDEADALALTFAQPVEQLVANHARKNHAVEELAKSQSQRRDAIRNLGKR